MKHRYLILSICAVSVAASGFAARPHRPVSSGEAGIRAQIKRWTRAFEHRDLKGVMAIYASSAVAFDINPPLQYVGKAAYSKSYAQFFAMFNGPLEVEWRDLSIKASGNVGFFNALQRVSGTMANGQKFNSWTRLTVCLEKIDGRWLDVHDHVSVPMDMQTGKALTDLTP